MTGLFTLPSPAIQALLATTGISLLPWLVFLPILYFSKTGNYTNPFSPRTLRLLLCFSIGSFLGDAFLHLIPHSFAHVSADNDHHHDHHHDHDSDHHHHDHHHDHDHNHHHDHTAETRIGVYIMIGVLAFFIIERLTSIIVGEHQHSHGASPHDSSSHDDSHQQQSESIPSPQHPQVFTIPDSTRSTRSALEHPGGESHENDEDSELIHRKGKIKSSHMVGADDDNVNNSSSLPSGTATETTFHFDQKSQSIDHLKPKYKDTIPSTIKVDHGTAFVTLVADFIHNFTDGLAIAAAFLSSNPAIGHHGESKSLSNIAISTCFAIIFHEIPHEIADFSLLLKSGVSMRTACLMQCITAFGAILGCLSGILTLNTMNTISDASTSQMFLPITAGGFIYVACSLMKSLHGDGDNDHHHHDNDAKHEDVSLFGKLRAFIMELLVISLGIGIMYIIALLE